MTTYNNELSFTQFGDERLIKNSSANSMILLPLLSKCPGKIKLVSFEDINQLEKLVEYLNQNPSIKRLSLAGHRTFGPESKDGFNLLLNHTQLEHLELDRCFETFSRTSLSFDSFVEAMKSNRSVTTLSLKKVDLTDERIKLLIEMLDSNKTLLTIHSDLSKDELSEIQSKLDRNQRMAARRRQLSCGLFKPGNYDTQLSRDCLDQQQQNRQSDRNDQLTLKDKLLGEEMPEDNAVSFVNRL